MEAEEAIFHITKEIDQEEVHVESMEVPKNRKDSSSDSNTTATSSNSTEILGGDENQCSYSDRSESSDEL